MDNREHPQLLGIEGISDHYRLQTLKLRRAEHITCTIYQLGAVPNLVETSRPDICLRSRNKVKLKVHKRVYEKHLKSPFLRGVTLWDRIPESVQWSTTKVKFKQGIKPHLSDLVRPVLK